jgi:hypothetical protein
MTGNESGAVKYTDGNIWIGNWSSFDGLPHVLEPIGTIGLGEEIIVEDDTVDAPLDVILAMDEHTIENGDTPDPTDTHSAWLLEGGEVVVICDSWN